MMHAGLALACIGWQQTPAEANLFGLFGGRYRQRQTVGYQPTGCSTCAAAAPVAVAPVVPVAPPAFYQA
ncbi:MAG: hypothetical protein ACRDD1_14580, partial [Planctomycetia bacterium]